MSKDEKRSGGFGKFLLGAAVGVGIGVLFAPKKGSETRQDLKMKLDELIGNIKNLDKDQVKEAFFAKVDEIKVELEDLDKEKVLNLAKEKGEQIKDKCQELIDMAIDKGTPILRDAAEEVREKAILVVREVLRKLENAEPSDIKKVSTKEKAKKASN